MVAFKHEFACVNPATVSRDQACGLIGGCRATGECRDDEFVFRVRVEPGCGRARGWKRARRRACPSSALGFLIMPSHPPTSISESRLHMTARQSVRSISHARRLKDLAD